MDFGSDALTSVHSKYHFLTVWACWYCITFFILKIYLGLPRSWYCQYFLFSKWCTIMCALEKSISIFVDLQILASVILHQLIHFTKFSTDLSAVSYYWIKCWQFCSVFCFPWILQCLLWLILIWRKFVKVLVTINYWLFNLSIL